MKNYYISFVFFKSGEYNYGSIYTKKDRITEKSLKQLEKDLSEQLKTKNIIFLLIKETEEEV